MSWILGFFCRDLWFLQEADAVHRNPVPYYAPYHGNKLHCGQRIVKLFSMPKKNAVIIYTGKKIQNPIMVSKMGNDTLTILKNHPCEWRIITINGFFFKNH